MRALKWLTHITTTYNQMWISSIAYLPRFGRSIMVKVTHMHTWTHDSCSRWQHRLRSLCRLYYTYTRTHMHHISLLFSIWIPFDLKIHIDCRNTQKHRSWMIAIRNDTTEFNTPSEYYSRYIHRYERILATDNKLTYASDWLWPPPVERHL